MSRLGQTSRLADRGNLGDSLTFGGPKTGAGPGNRTPGAWAGSRSSAIYLIDQGKTSNSPASGIDLWRSDLASLCVVALLTLLASSNLIDVYGSFAIWALAALPATLIACLIALAGTQPALRLWWQLVFLALAQWVIGPLICLNGSAIGHVIPSLETLSQGASSSLGAFKYLISIQPPLGYEGGGLMALWTMDLWFGFLAGLLAISARLAQEALVLLPLAANLVSSALLGTQTGTLPMTRGVLLGLLTVIWFSWRWRLLEAQRWLSSLVIIVLAATLALGSCLLLPQSRQTLRERYQPPISPYDYASPLSSMRSYLTKHRKDKLLTVENLPSGTPVRLAAMDSFDGNVWNLSDSRQASDSSDYRQVGGSIANTAHGRSFKASFTVGPGLQDYWLPLAGAASSIDFAGRGQGRDFYYNVGTSSAIIPSQTQPRMTYQETGIIPVIPSAEQIARAQADHIDQPRSKDVPDAVHSLATAMAGGSGTGGASAQALADQLKDSGWFSHGLAGDYPSQPGHGNYRINSLLAGGAMVGDSEQYASAMALMARDLGLPARVVFGFVPKDKDGAISGSRTKKQDDGSTKVEFTGNDIQAWVEVRLKGYGWVPFYPTPKETKVPDQNQNLTPPNPQTLVRQPPVPLTDPLRDENQARSQSALAGQNADEQKQNQWSQVWHIAGMVALYGSPLWALLTVCALILALKAAQLAYWRRHGSPGRRVGAGWDSVCALARQSGLTLPARGTRREQALAMARKLDLDPSDLLALSRQADYSAFAGKKTHEQMAGSYWKAVDQVRRSLLASQPFLRRLRTRLSLRGLFPGRPRTESSARATAGSHDRPQGRNGSGSGIRWPILAKVRASLTHYGRMEPKPTTASDPSGNTHLGRSGHRGRQGRVCKERLDS
ncbi:transglutaminase [Bifidobacterium aemilianum]|uniref:Transglutaminase n=1 Tax=Bifidobacterium aemilianum TaxID=2493120 RepID=A0A366K7S8_9BIFI|nr:DUF3488 and transglutaminase-like domain-containing protein [Bifidobacterium aemilianum]RBP97218.1 transglutaminase [Bifidobacterium aemilianum]